MNIAAFFFEMNALCCQKVWDLSSALTWQHVFSVSGVTLAKTWGPNAAKTNTVIRRNNYSETAWKSKRTILNVKKNYNVRNIALRIQHNYTRGISGRAKHRHLGRI